MKIRVNSRAHAGVLLSEVPFGTVVTRSIMGDATYYIVTSPMDGSGRKCLVTLTSGTFKDLPQSTPVIVVDDAELVVGRAPHGTLLRDARRYQALRGLGGPLGYSHPDVLDEVADAKVKEFFG